MKRLLLAALGLVLFISALWLGWSFRAGNTTAIDLDLIWIQISDIELWRVILLAIGIGALASTLLVGFAWMRSRLLNLRYRRAIHRLEIELHGLRSLQLVAPDEPLVSSSAERN